MARYRFNPKMSRRNRKISGSMVPRSVTVAVRIVNDSRQDE